VSERRREDPTRNVAVGTSPFDLPPAPAAPAPAALTPTRPPVGSPPAAIVEPVAQPRSGRGDDGRTRRIRTHAPVIDDDTEDTDRPDLTPPPLPEGAFDDHATYADLSSLGEDELARGTIVRLIGDSKMPRPVELKRVDGQHAVQPSLRAAHQGRYVLGQVLGRGGMGVVRLVKDLDVGRDVAMKTLNPGDPDARTLVSSLIAEAQTTGQLEHPNIVPVYELGAQADGTVFYTMRAVSGSTLKEVLSRLRDGDPTTRHDFTERKLLAIFQQICLALHYAHSRGVVHRDIKPDNIVLGAYGEVLVLDWGIAYVIGRASDPLARAGLVVGTPHYMAPEQARGEIHRVDGRTDIFSLGVVLYELLTLTTPITERGTEKALSAVRALSAAPRADVRPDGTRVPEALADLCVRSMAPVVEERLASARELHDRIEDYLEGSAERERRARLATEEFAVGLQAYSTHMALRRQREAFAIELSARARQVHRWDPLPVKRALAEDEARAQLTALEVSRAFTNTANHLHAVLGLEPDHQHARQLLANLYWSRFEDAERKGEVEDMVYFADLFLRFNDHQRGPLPMGSGRVTVRTFPEGGLISAYDFGAPSLDPKTQPGRLLGTAPVSDIELPMGMYLLVSRKDGYKNAQQAVFVRPGVHQKYLLSMPAWAAEEALVGRDGELGLLQYNLERSISGRELRRMLVTGPDGIGKARLLAAFNDHVESLDTVVQFFFAECHETHALVPYSPIIDALRIRAGVKPEDGPNAVRRQLRAMLLASIETSAPASGTERERVERVVENLLLVPGMCSSLAVGSAEDGPPIPAPTEPPIARRDRLDLAFVELIRLLTIGNPALFYFQEVEHLDDASRRVLQLAPRELSRNPLFVLGMGTDVDSKSGWDEHVVLGPLGETPVAAFVRNLLKGPLPAGLLERVVKVSGGVPWLVVDAVRRMATSGELVDVQGRFALREELPPPVPSTMLQARRRLIQDLPPGLSLALRLAAVIGDTFWSEALGALGVVSPDTVCAELTERELIRALPHSRYPGTHAFAFRSLLFREIVYDSIREPDESARLHRQVADWMLERYRGDVRETAELARHVETARDERWACRLYTELGDVARTCGAFGIARECYLRGISNAQGVGDRSALEERLESVRGHGG
jgi:hypothetical protein